MEKMEYYTSSQEKKNYRPISLLLVFSKAFQKIIFNKMYNFLQNEQLLSPNQSS